MSANFLLANNPCFLDGTAGSATAIGSGAYTIIVLFRPTAGNNNTGIVAGRTSGSNNRSLLEDTLHLYGEADFSSGDATTLVQGNWYVGAQTKPAGSAAYRHHLWQYNSGGTGTMVHGVSTGDPGTHGDGSAIDTIRIGNMGVNGNCDVAIVALLDSVLADATLDTLKSNLLTAWTAISPDELITFENWNGSTGWSTRVGTSALSSVNGTVGAGANPPDFSFDLGSTVDLTPVTMTLAAEAVDPDPGAVSVALTPATMTLAAQVTDPDPGLVTVGLTPATMTLAGVAVDPDPGAVSVALTPAAMTLSAVPLSIAGASVVALTPVGMILAPGSVTPDNADDGVDISVCLGEPHLSWHLGTPELAWTLGPVEVDC